MSFDSPPTEPLAQAWEEVYDLLRLIARRSMDGERPDHTLQGTAVAHEAWLRLRDQRALDLSDRPAVARAASAAVRRVLVDHARRHTRAKRGGKGASRLPIESVDDHRAAPATAAAASAWDDDIVALDEALTRLAALHPRAATVVELLYFGGLAQQEAADALHVSLRTVGADWTLARNWLYDALVAQKRRR